MGTIERPPRLILACVTAVLAPPIVSAFALGVIAMVTGAPQPADQAIMQMLAFMLVGASDAIMVGVPLMLLIGLPWHLYLTRNNTCTLERYATGGAVAGIAAALVFAFIGRADLKLVLCSLALINCTVGGVLFWSIRRPDLGTA